MERGATPRPNPVFLPTTYCLLPTALPSPILVVEQRFIHPVGIVTGIEDRHLGADLHSPLAEVVQQFLRLFRHGVGEVHGLADVLLEIVKLCRGAVEVFDQPVGSLADDSMGRCSTPST